MNDIYSTCSGSSHLLLVSESLDLVNCYLRRPMEFCECNVKVGDGGIIQIGHCHYKSPYKRGGGESEKKVGVKKREEGWP